MQKKIHEEKQRADEVVTVVIITYNHSSSIRQALESVLAQKTTFAFCVHVLDDASTDGTSEIVREFAARYPERVLSFVRSANGGVMNVREGLSRITTKYYAVLEGDDCWCDENKLQIQVDILEENPDCTVCGHNTLCKYLGPLPKKESHPFLKAKTQKIRGIPTHFFGKKVVVPHLSSRVYVTASQSRDTLRNPDVLVWDLPSYYWALSQGSCYYLDRIMSVYHSGSGIFSTASDRYQRQLGVGMMMMITEELDPKYTPFLMRKAANVMRLPWFKKWCFCCWWSPRTREKICSAFLGKPGKD
jgi:glycosyltransferase involved in cell wall biosynthesis